ncbi:10642_t:CDS:2, partial [Gigaspora rosea]
PNAQKTRSQLNNTQRKQICEYHIKNPSAKHQDIADEFKRRPKYPLIETAMNIWVGQVSAAGLVLTDELVKSKGREFGSLLGISENKLKFSNEWVTNYKKRNSLRRYKLYSEAASTPLEFLPNERIKLQNLLSQYELEDFRIQDRKILLLVDNAPSHSSPESNKTLNFNNVEVDDNQLNFENEVLMDDFLDSRDNDETERSLKMQRGSTRGRPHRSTRGRPRGSTRGRPHRSTHGRPHRSTRGRPRGSTYKKQEPIPILLANETKNLLKH